MTRIVSGKVHFDQQVEPSEVIVAAYGRIGTHDRLAINLSGKEEAV